LLSGGPRPIGVLNLANPAPLRDRPGRAGTGRLGPIHRAPGHRARQGARPGHDARLEPPRLCRGLPSRAHARLAGCARERLRPFRRTLRDAAVRPHAHRRHPLGRGRHRPQPPQAQHRLRSLRPPSGLHAAAVLAVSSTHEGQSRVGREVLKRNFAPGRVLHDLEDFNAQLAGWQAEVADQRIHGTRTTHQRPIAASRCGASGPVPCGSRQGRDGRGPGSTSKGLRHEHHRHLHRFGQRLHRHHAHPDPEPQAALRAQRREGARQRTRASSVAWASSPLASWS